MINPVLNNVSSSTKSNKTPANERGIVRLLLSLDILKNRPWKSSYQNGKYFLEWKHLVIIINFDYNHDKRYIQKVMAMNAHW